MKNFVIVIICCTSTLILDAQEMDSINIAARSQQRKNAIGIKLNSPNRYFMYQELNYQRYLKPNRRIEVGAMYKMGGNAITSGFLITGSLTYQFVKPLAQSSWNVYYGPGLSYRHLSWEQETRLIFGVGGQVGIEFDAYKKLRIPLKLSLDLTPTIFRGYGTNFFRTVGGFSIRYTF